MAVQIGQDVGSYHIIEALGQGGMATVYKAYDMRLERQVAIKFIRVGIIGPEQLEQVLKRFEREAKALARFMHPNIVPVHDFGEHEGVPYLVMGYLPGGSVKELTGKPMPYDQVARLLAPVARALEYAHKQNVIHRDVKPGNILLTAEGTPVLSDFGIAKILGSDQTTQLTSTGVGVGTPEYMAPEQWQGEVVPQTDIYSLGVVFYELVTGRRPYMADTPAGVLLKQATEPLPYPRQFIPDLPEAVEQVLFKALAKEVKNRYASMGEFAGALERLGFQSSPSMSFPKMEETGETLIRPRERGTSSASMPSITGVAPAQQAPASQASVSQRSQMTPSQMTPSQATPERPSLSSIQTRTVAQASPAVQAPPVSQQVPPAVPAQPERPVKTTGRKTAWLWAGSVIVALCVVGAVIAGIATQGFGLLKNQPAATKAAFLTATTTPAAGKTPQPARTGTATTRATSRSTPAPILTVTDTLVPTPTPMVSDRDGMTQMYVPAGDFLMGAADSDAAAAANEKPQHKVYLDAFWIDQTEVTNAMYARCVSAGACQRPYELRSGTRATYYGNPQYDDYPVIYVDWNQATAYCAWAGRRLPTEAEWEKAARGTDGRIYPWGNQPPDCTKANYAGKEGDTPCVGDTTKVGSYPDGASPYGALDMAGNVWEWVNDWYSETYYQGSPDRNPTGPSSSNYRVIRDGSWNYGAMAIRSSYRGSYGAVNRNKDGGFRCAVSP